MFYDLFKKKYNQNILYIVFAFALVFVYWFKMPYAHRFGRYMMPIIPFFILVAGIGFRDLFKMIGVYFKNRNFVIGLYAIVSAIILIYSVKGYTENKKEYSDACKYINDRQVAAAMWIKNNTSEGDIIATHDVGAIGFYCGRKIVDVAGLVTPELISKINDKDYNIYLTEFLKKSGVTYLAFLREWYRVVNQNPLFSTIEVSNFETMEVFKFVPDKTHILIAEAKDRNMYAMEMMGKRNTQALQQAMQVLQGSLTVDPQSSYTYYLIANVYLMLNDKNNFEKNINKALDIFPEYKEALFQLGNYYKSLNKNAEAKSYLDKYLKVSPNDKKALDLYNSIDSVKTK